ncbi:unnamed protein product [Cladocopium goreaui]|uniref:Retrovirus-related Pol polyprotein from transposon TNT 1-94 n=1 Tax=Cladocopium goreaui TaxID=2562237 RepID=A0A9P1D957_9DINO|nr:unnamed protein product [Cladocopium goreaui]
MWYPWFKRRQTLHELLVTLWWLYTTNKLIDLAKWQDFNVSFKAWLFYGNKHFETESPSVFFDKLATGMGLRFGDNYASCSCQDSKPCNFNLAALMGVPSFTTKDRTLLDQVLGLERMRAEYIPDDIMLSVLVRALPKAIQPHVQLQLNETSTYDQVRAMLVSYDALQLHGPQVVAMQLCLVLLHEQPIQMGFNGTTSKSLMRVLLTNALSSTMAMGMPADPLTSSSSSTSGPFGMVMAFLLTIICLFGGFLVVTAHFGAALQGRLQTLRMDVALRKVLSMLKAYRREHGLDEIAEEEVPTTDEVDESEVEDRNETYQQKVERYQNSGMDEVSDDELWRMVHHGALDEEDTAAFNRRYTDTHLENIMRETNRILAARMQMLRAEYEAAAVRNDQLSMDAIENEMTECTHYSI